MVTYIKTHHSYTPPKRGFALIPLLRREGCERIGSGEWLAVPPHPWPLSPDGGEGKVTLDLTPSPPSGERVAKGRVRGHWNAFGILSQLQGTEVGWAILATETDNT